MRELRNYVERALVLADAGTLSRRAAEASAGTASGGEPNAIDIESPFKVAKERVVLEFERVYLERLMTWAAGNVSRAARKAKIDRMYLHRLLQRHAVKRESQVDE